VQTEVPSVPLQETFDRVARHLRRQGGPSTKEGPGGRTICAYRGNGGRMCAAGCLIPDELYRFEMESRSVADDQPAGVVIASLGHDLGLVASLQGLHDGIALSWSEAGLLAGLRELAGGFGLNCDALSG